MWAIDEAKRELQRGLEVAQEAQKGSHPYRSWMALGILETAVKVAIALLECGDGIQNLKEELTA